MWVSRQTNGRSWVCSAIVHILLIVSLTTVGLRRADRPTIFLQAVRSEGSELVILDISIQEPEAQDAPLLLDTIGDLSAASIDVPSPVGEFARGEKSSGDDHATAGTKANARGGAGRATFFGTVAQGDRFVYIVDCSKSMGAREGQRLQRALEELVRSVQELRSDQQFYVLLFSSGTRNMFDEEMPAWRPASSENKRKLHEWVTTHVYPDTGTYPQEALYRGLQLRPSAVFLLSDGDFSRPERPHRGTISEIRTLDIVENMEGSRPPIHTLAFEDPQGKLRLSELSERTSGRFQYIPSATTVPQEKGHGDLLERRLPADPFAPQMNSASDAAARLQALELLRAGDFALKRGKPKKAGQQYRRVVSEFPRTRAASNAHFRLSQLAPKEF